MDENAVDDYDAYIIKESERLRAFEKEIRKFRAKDIKRRNIWRAIIIIIAVLIPTAFVDYYFGLKIQLIFQAALLYGMLVQGLTPIILDWIEGL